MQHHDNAKTAMGAAILGAIGVVYGDIGTSVLYAVQTVFDVGQISPTPANVYGILSLFFWTLTIIVSLKYVTLVLRADNHGEGGLVALLALATQAVHDRPRTRNLLLLLGIFGACLFYGDGVITPAISVLSAVEGLEVVSHAFKPWVIPLTLVILLGLFLVQKHGTAGIGRLFGPVMVLWFIVIAVMGAVQIAGHPDILRAINPLFALRFIARQPLVTFVTLGAVVLCVTGGEALYADMGHFGRRPIQIAWYALVMPALTINYFGQGALLLAHPAAMKNPFFLMAPAWLTLPLVGLATAATVIASQALISGAYSATKQIIQLGFLPRLQVLHTNAQETGQIYLPFVNWALFVAIVLAVVLFRSSANLAGAYGIAVTTNMIITTFMTYFVVRHVWHYPLPVALGATSFFMLIDFAFWSSNLLKLIEGGWFPLLIAGALFILMLTWKQGRTLLTSKLRRDSLGLSEFLDALFLEPPVRVNGTAVFLSANPGTVPNALLHNLKHNMVLHRYNLFVNVRNHEVPWIAPEDRLTVTPLGHDCWQVCLNYGFMDEPNLPLAIQPLQEQGCPLDPMKTSYFISRDNVVPTLGEGMAPWREMLFAQMHHNASSVADFLRLPSNGVVELGSKVEI